jgi:hypothetical protein
MDEGQLIDLLRSMTVMLDELRIQALALRRIAEAAGLLGPDDFAAVCGEIRAGLDPQQRAALDVAELRRMLSLDPDRSEM